MVSSARTKLDPFEEQAYRMILSLRIRRIQKDDYGEYECEARNPLGSSIGSMELYGVSVIGLACCGLDLNWIGLLWVGSELDWLVVGWI